MGEKLRGRIQKQSLENCDLIQAAGCLLFAQNTGRVLTLLRSNTRYSNTWGLAGGKVDAGETVVEGLMREIAEEIGTVAITKTIPLETFTSADSKFAFYTFMCIVGNEFIPALNHEHAGYAWTTIDNLPRPLHPGVYATIAVDDVIREKAHVVARQYFNPSPAN